MRVDIMIIKKSPIITPISSNIKLMKINVLRCNWCVDITARTNNHHQSKSAPGAEKYQNCFQIVILCEKIVMKTIHSGTLPSNIDRVCVANI